jgi:ferredoxin
MEISELMTRNAYVAAQAASDTLIAAAPDSVRFKPGDCALLIGPAKTLMQRSEALRIAGLRPAMLCTDPADIDVPLQGVRALPGQLAELSGWMGQFTAKMRTAQGMVDLAPLSVHEDGHFDWVLDFSTTPQAPAAVPPLGYYTLAADDFPALKKTLLEIAGRVHAGFEKPRYFSFDAQKCAHERQGIAGCDACRPVCAAKAISRDAGDKSAAIRIEPNLCQGCGSCMLVCPSGAIRYDHPKPSFSLSRLIAMLAAWRAADGGRVGLWIGTEYELAETPAGWLAYAVNEPASLGLEFWLAALVSGCDRVAIAAKQVPDATLHALQQQLALGQSLLAGLGFPAALGLAASVAELAEIPALSAPVVVDLAVGDDKRAVLFAAIDALVDQADAPPVSVTLAAGPLGLVVIAADKCTLCAACVGICPSGALSLPGTITQLAFTEQRCLQCGLCANVCPEKAVTLTPRLLVSSAARQAPRVVAVAEPFACTGCGKQFATQAMIKRSQAMMAGHPMFQGEQARLMTLCPDCRQRAMAGVPG